MRSATAIGERWADLPDGVSCPDDGFFDLFSRKIDARPAAINSTLNSSLEFRTKSDTQVQPKKLSNTTQKRHDVSRTTFALSRDSG